MTKSRGLIAKKHVWTPEQDAVLLARYPNEKAETIAVDLGIKLHVLYKRVGALKILKSPEFLASPQSGRLDGIRGAESRFKKGNVPWTLGKVGLRISPTTEFKPGVRPMNYMEVGSEKMHMGYVWVKISDGGWPKSWRPKHHVIWEAAYECAIPKDHLLFFKDGDNKNFDVANLELISKAGWIARHRIHNLPEHLVSLIRLKSKLTRQIKKKEAA